MAVMQTAGRARTLPPSATVTESETEYVVELDVSDFALSELSVRLEGDEVTVVGEQRESGEDADAPFRLCERLEESFRLPGDADGEWLTALFEHGRLELHVPKLGPCPNPRHNVRIVPKRHGLFNPDATPC
jgi:HSP20 family molecular chaperone IbpA